MARASWKPYYTTPGLQNDSLIFFKSVKLFKIFKKFNKKLYYIYSYLYKLQYYYINKVKLQNYCKFSKYAYSLKPYPRDTALRIYGKVRIWYIFTRKYIAMRGLRLTKKNLQQTARSIFISSELHGIKYGMHRQTRTYSKFRSIVDKKKQVKLQKQVEKQIQQKQKLQKKQIKTSIFKKTKKK